MLQTKKDELHVFFDMIIIMTTMFFILIEINCKVIQILGVTCCKYSVSKDLNKFLHSSILIIIFT